MCVRTGNKTFGRCLVQRKISNRTPEVLLTPYFLCNFKWYSQLESRTFAGEVGGVAAQNRQGIVRRQRGLADGCDKGVTGRHQAQTTTQRGHGQLCL